MKGRRVQSGCLTVCACLFLAACGKSGTSGRESVGSGEGIVVEAMGEQEWVYLPEVFQVKEKGADFARGNGGKAAAPGGRVTRTEKAAPPDSTIFFCMMMRRSMDIAST